MNEISVVREAPTRPSSLASSSGPIFTRVLTLHDRVRVTVLDDAYSLIALPVAIAVTGVTSPSDELFLSSAELACGIDTSLSLSLSLTPSLDTIVLLLSLRCSSALFLVPDSWLSHCRARRKAKGILARKSETSRPKVLSPPP